MLVRHDAKLQVTVKCNAVGHTRPCSKRIITAPELDADMTVESAMHGKVSGYDSGVSVKYAYKLVNPEQDILKDGELCTCKECAA